MNKGKVSCVRKKKQTLEFLHEKSNYLAVCFLRNLTLDPHIVGPTNCILTKARLVEIE
jgi:hypothetical protein